MKIKIDPQYDIIKFLNISDKEISVECDAALHNYGLIYKDNTELNEHLLCPYQTLDVIRSLKSKTINIKKYVSKMKKELKQIIELCEKHDCAYVRIINK